LKFTLNQIYEETYSGPFEFEETVDVSDIPLTIESDIRKISTVDVTGLCTVDKKEIIFNFSIKGEIILPCARTLVDVSHKLDINATEVFSTDSTILPDNEEEIHQVDGEIIDLAPYIKENIILNIPFRVFSEEEVIDEGKDWSYFTEDEKIESDSDKIDPRLEKLQLLLDKEDKTK